MGKFTLLATAALAIVATSSAHAQSGAVSLQEAVTVAMQSNPEILQAQFNKEAVPP